MRKTNRRTFLKVVVTGATSGVVRTLPASSRSPMKPESFILTASDWVPNNLVIQLPKSNRNRRLNNCQL